MGRKKYQTVTDANDATAKRQEILLCMTMVFSGKFFLSVNLMEKKILSVTWAEKHILGELYALKNMFL